MKCSYCGTETELWQLYCPCCGTKQPNPNHQEPTVLYVRKEPEQKAPAVDFDIPPVGELTSETPAPSVTEAQAEEAFPVIPEYHRPSPMLQLPTKRGLCKMIFLGILTLGIYPIAIYSRLVQEMNMVASRYDGERTMSYFGMLLLSPITLFVYGFVWMHSLCRRMGAELQRRGIGYGFGPRHFWLWGVLGCLILVGPCVFIHKMMKAMNFINADYNRVG